MVENHTIQVKLEGWERIILESIILLRPYLKKYTLPTFGSHHLDEFHFPGYPLPGEYSVKIHSLKNFTYERNFVSNFNKDTEGIFGVLDIDKVYNSTEYFLPFWGLTKTGSLLKISLKKEENGNIRKYICRAEKTSPLEIFSTTKEVQQFIQTIDQQIKKLTGISSVA